MATAQDFPVKSRVEYRVGKNYPNRPELETWVPGTVIKTYSRGVKIKLDEGLSSLRGGREVSAQFARVRTAPDAPSLGKLGDILHLADAKASPEITKKVKKAASKKKAATKKRPSKKKAEAARKVVVQEAPAKSILDHLQFVMDTPGGKQYVLKALTPEVAALLLENNHPRQRKIDPIHVAKIERALLMDKYVWVGDPIQLDEELQLINGQHRAWAVFNSGKSIPGMTVYVLSHEDALLHIDTDARGRTVAQLQHMTGRKKTHSAVAAAVLFRRNNYEPVRGRKLSPHERVEILDDATYVDELHALYSKSRPTVRFTAGPLAVIQECLTVDYDAAMTFFTAVATNNPVAPDGTIISQAQLLSTWLLRTRSHATDRRAGAGFLVESADKTARAWNAWRQGRKIGKLLPSKDGKVAKII